MISQHWNHNWKAQACLLVSCCTKKCSMQGQTIRPGYVIWMPCYCVMLCLCPFPFYPLPSQIHHSQNVSSLLITYMRTNNKKIMTNVDLPWVLYITIYLKGKNNKTTWDRKNEWMSNPKKCWIWRIEENAILNTSNYCEKKKKKKTC